MKALLIPLLLGLVLTCSLARADAITYSGGDGSSEAKAIFIHGADGDLAATHAEYAYLAQKFPHYTMIKQSLLTENKRMYDRLDFSVPGGSSQDIYFDITDTFGK